MNGRFLGKTTAAAAVTYLLALIGASAALAGPPDSVSQVKNIKPGGAASNSIDPLLDPDPAVLNGVLYFVADDGSHGKELWRSDGTDAEMVDDINASGSAGSSPDFLTVMGDELFFRADDGIKGFELWKTDGTGAEMVKDIWDGSLPSSPVSLTVMGGALYFSASDGGGGGKFGRELWTSDGTEDGTELVKDINTAGNSSPSELTDVGGGLLMFSATNGTDGSELWKSNGSGAGTEQVKNIKTGSGSSDIAELTNAAGTIFFTADDGSNGRELWKTNGMDAGTVPVDNTDLSEGAGPAGLAAIGSTVYFAASDGLGAHGRELWKSDGTSVSMVKDISPTGQSQPINFTNVAGELYFAAAPTSSDGRELWKSDGSEVGTVQVKDINTTGSSDPSYLTDIDGTLFFSATDGLTANGSELWRSDGSDAGTVRIGNINPGAASSSPNYLTKVGTKLMFGADDGSDGFELWKAVDTLPPQTTIDSGPGEGQTIGFATPTFAFSSDDNPATFECSVDGAAFSPCSSPVALTLTNGAHKFAVRAKDASSNVDSTPAERNFTVNVSSPPVAQVPSIGTGSLTADTTAPTAGLSGAAAQKLGKSLVVTVSCPDEACMATATGSVKRSKLGSSTKSIAQGSSARFSLKISKKLGKSIKRALRARKKVAASIQVVVADPAGNKRTLSKNIRIKP